MDKIETPPTSPSRGPVPCNGCTLCCQGDALRLLPGDNPDDYQTVPHFSMPGERMLAHKPNGDCIYLAADGCSIHARRPLMCRSMDCRTIAAQFTYTQARKLYAKNIVKFPIWRRGKDLLKVRNLN